MASSTSNIDAIFNGLTFFLRPGPERARIKNMIQERGGTLSNIIKAGVIRLTEDLLHIEGFHIDFIIDSCSKNKLQDRTKYQLPKYKSKVTSNTVSVDVQKLSKARQVYQPEEDEVIIQYVARYATDYGTTGSVSGNSIWREMEKKKVTTHSWQSMKDRYLKYLQEREPNFEFEPFTMRLRRGEKIPFAVNNSSLQSKSSSSTVAISKTTTSITTASTTTVGQTLSKPMKTSNNDFSVRTRQVYQPEEDEVIIQYVARYATEYGTTGSVSGNSIWREMERKKVTTRSWQSMKDRFLKHLQDREPNFEFEPLTMRMCGGEKIPFAVNNSSLQGKSSSSMVGIPLTATSTTTSTTTTVGETLSKPMKTSTDHTSVKGRKRKMFTTKQSVFTASPRDINGNRIDTTEDDKNSTGQDNNHIPDKAESSPSQKDAGGTVCTEKKSSQEVDALSDCTIDLFQSISSCEHSTQGDHLESDISKSKKKTCNQNSNSMEYSGAERNTPNKDGNSALNEIVPREVTIVVKDIVPIVSPGKKQKKHMKKTEEASIKHKNTCEGNSPASNARLSPKLCSTRVKNKTEGTGVIPPKNINRIVAFNNSDDDDSFDEQLLKQAVTSTNGNKTTEIENKTANAVDPMSIDMSVSTESLSSFSLSQPSAGENSRDIAVPDVHCNCGKSSAYRQALKSIQTLRQLVNEADEDLWLSIRNQMELDNIFI